MEEKMDAATSRLEMLEAELRLREREMEEAEAQKENMEKDIHSLKQSVKESKAELKSLQDNIREAEEQMRGLEQDVRSTHHLRDEAKLEVERLAEQIRQSSASCEESSRQEKVKYQELQDLMRSLVEREKEHQEARIALNKIRKDVEKEENRLNRLVGSANTDLEAVRVELTDKQEELETMRKEYTELQKKTDELQYKEETFSELSKTCRDLEQDLQLRDQEKTELAKALSVSYEEVQRLRKESAQMQEKMSKERAELENTLRDMEGNLEQTKQSDKLSDDKENNKTVTEVRIIPAPSSAPLSSAPLSSTHFSNDADWKKDALRERLAEEQDYLRFQLRQQMLRHSETMQSTRLQSEETIDCLRRKLNTLQGVLFNTNPDVRSINDLSRSRSGSPAHRYGRTRSPSPLTRSGRSYMAQRRSRSSEGLSSPEFSEREFL
ncbi:myosin heavy chain [Aplysia californica]|uniref:Myosin heavy chain n=1 Tax=Aplysia californica TaxID=6500 RepID=A0ABM1VX72_APLCA|nr:myosin heavy chain [Aplysia californica]